MNLNIGSPFGLKFLNRRVISSPAIILGEEKIMSPFQMRRAIEKCICTCGTCMEYKDTSETTFICRKCGFEKPIS